jgi:hypothetical protein
VRLEVLVELGEEVPLEQVLELLQLVQALEPELVQGLEEQ